MNMTKPAVHCPAAGDHRMNRGPFSVHVRAVPVSSVRGLRGFLLRKVWPFHLMSFCTSLPGISLPYRAARMGSFH